jgi:hypothetical protein
MALPAPQHWLASTSISINQPEPRCRAEEQVATVERLAQQLVFAQQPLKRCRSPCLPVHRAMLCDPELL